MLSGSSAQAQTPSPTASQRPDLDLSLRDVAQQAVNLMNCHDTAGTHRVLEIRRAALPGTAAPPDSQEGSATQIGVVLAGDFNLSGLFPGFSGWASQIELLFAPVPDRGMAFVGAGPPRSEGQLLVSASDTPIDVRPTNVCQTRPIPSRDPRLAQNCRARQFAIVPQVCGSIQPIREQVEIGLDDNVFVPAELLVPGVTEVTWVNYGQSQHTIAGPGWDEPIVMSPGDTWVVTYAGSGTFEYHCTIHPDDMHLRLTVAPP
jgi:plastocyanin